MFLILPLFIAAFGGFGGTLLYQRVVRSTWAEVAGVALAIGGTYRFSIDQVENVTPAGIATALEQLGAFALYWPDDTYPTDWPDDDRRRGRIRVQVTLPSALAATFGGYMYFPPAANFRAWRLRGA